MKNRGRLIPRDETVFTFSQHIDFRIQSQLKFLHESSYDPLSIIEVHHLLVYLPAVCLAMLLAVPSALLQQNVRCDEFSGLAPLSVPLDSQCYLVPGFRTSWWLRFRFVSGLSTCEVFVLVLRRFRLLPLLSSLFVRIAFLCSLCSSLSMASA